MEELGVATMWSLQSFCLPYLMRLVSEWTTPVFRVEGLHHCLSLGAFWGVFLGATVAKTGFPIRQSSPASLLCYYYHCPMALPGREMMVMLEFLARRSLVQFFVRFWVHFLSGFAVPRRKG